MENDELRMYSFNSMYMNGIHNGIQAGHGWVDMAVKYHRFMTQDVPTTSKAQMFWDWADNHKTVIIKNGGTTQMLQDIITALRACDKSDTPYPWIEWREPDLDNALTSVSVVLPARMFAYKPEYDFTDETDFVVGVMPEKFAINPLTETDQMLYDVISNKRFAQ